MRTRLTVYVTWIVPAPKGLAGMTKIIDCEACGKPVSVDAPACPNCGHPRRHKRQHRWLYIVAVFAFLGGAYWLLSGLVTSVTDYASDGMPKCVSATAEADAKRAWKSSPTEHLLGLEIIQFENLKSISETSALHECAAQVTLNNAQTYEMSYEFVSNKDGTYLIKVLIRGL